MFIKKDQTWIKYNPEYDVDKFNNNLSEIKLHSKCVNANVYMPIQELGEKRIYTFENISISTNGLGQIILSNVPKYMFPYLFTYGFEWKLTVTNHSILSMNKTSDVVSSTWIVNITNSENLDFTLTLSTVNLINVPIEKVKITFVRQEDVYRDLGFYPSFTSLEDYNYSLKTYFSPTKAVEKQLNNFKMVDLATTVNIPVSVFIINPEIDGFITKIGHRVLFKNQNDSTENGIYVYTIDQKFVRENDLLDINSSYRAIYHVKLGVINKEKQFFLLRDSIDAKYPTISANDNLYFDENHNYLLRHKLEYKNLSDVEFEDLDVTNSNIFPYPSKIYAVGEYGLYFITDGITSYAKELGTRERLNSIFIGRDFLNAETGNVWICGRRGTILHSINNSIDFVEQKSNTNQDLFDVSFVDANFGMIVGSLGTILWSNTGGLIWKNDLTLSAENLQKNLNSVKFYAANKAIIVGDRGIVFLLTYTNNIWTSQKVDIVKSVDNVTSYVINKDLKSVDYFENTIANTKTAYIVGSDNTLFTLNLDDTSTIYLDVKFYQTTNIAHSTTKYNTCLWKNIDNRLLLGGDSSDVYEVDFSIFSLIPNTNIYQTLVDYSLVISPNYGSNIKPKNVKSLKFFDLANYYYLAGDNGALGEFRQSTAYTFNPFYSAGLFPSKLLVLDAKIADKMYFSDDNGEPVYPNTLKNLSSGSIVNFIDYTNPSSTDILNFYSIEKTFFDYLDYYAPVPHNRIFKPYDPTVNTNYVYGSTSLTGYFNITNYINSNTKIVFYDNETSLIMIDSVFNVVAGDNIRLYIIDSTETLVFLDETFLVKSVLGTTVTIDAVFDENFKNDLYNSVIPFKLRVKNLNCYPFNLSMTKEQVVNGLIDVLTQHSLSNFYEFKYSNPSSYYGIEIKVKNVSWTKYINGKTDISLFSGFLSTTINYLLDYKNTVNLFKYGPRYNVLDFLNGINNSIFVPNKTFNMPQNTFVYEGSPLLNTQFVFNVNTIVMGSSFQPLYDTFFVNTFVDIKNIGPNTIKTRSLLVDKYVNVTNGITRYHFVFDFDLQSYFSGVITSDNIFIRSRNKLSEISTDLRYADDRQLDLFYIPTDVITSKSFFNASEKFNTDSYSKILSSDIDVRNYCSGVIYTDDKFDLTFNLFKIDGDPNFNFQPVDIYDIGIDPKIKNAISISRFNYDKFVVPSTNPHEGLKLHDVDFTKYNFRLVDGLTLQLLSQKYTWLLEAEIENAIIGEDNRGLVWYSGDWICGTWKDGTWYSGRFFDGIWVNGIWDSRQIEDRIFSVLVKSNTSLVYSQWFNGTWITGEWFNGTWFNGSWNNGTWDNGHWLDGTRYNGRWNNGVWEGGNWINGVWYNGRFNTDNVFSTWYNGFWYGGDFENGLWKNGEFNQLRVRNAIPIISRFGTKSTAQQKSIWEHGVFIRGEFHSFLNLDVDGNPLPSISYKNSVWLAGHWKNGIVYGGTFKQGVWDTGVWKRGYVEGGLSLTPTLLIQPDLSTTRWLLTLTPTNPHKMKKGDDFYIIGTPNHLLPTSNFMDYLGLNTVPKKHKIYNVELNGNIIVEIIDPSFTPLILNINNTNSGYVDLYSVFTIKDMTWSGGIFNNGLWLNGTWLNGMWVDGIWDNGVWMDPNIPLPPI